MKVARSEEPVRNWADVNNKHTNHNLHWAVVLQDWRKTFLFTLVNILRPHSCSLMTFTAIHSHSAYITIVTTVQPTYERTPRSVGRIDSLWKYIWRYSYVCNLAAVSLAHADQLLHGHESDSTPCIASSCPEDTFTFISLSRAFREIRWRIVDGITDCRSTSAGCCSDKDERAVSIIVRLPVITTEGAVYSRVLPSSSPQVDHALFRRPQECVGVAVGTKIRATH